MVGPFVRNPMLRRLLQCWWLPVLVAPLLWMLLETWTWTPSSRPHHCYMPILLYGAAIAGFAGAAYAHAATATLRERLRHTLAGHRFLCPHCLCFGAFRFACGACGNEVEPAAVHTRGAFVPDCSHCGALLFPRSGDTADNVRAWCRHCARVCEREIHHERQVQVVATLREGDFAAFCTAIRACPVRTRGGIDAACHDDGARLTFVFSLTDRTGRGATPRAAHALRASGRIWLWLDGADVEPLKLGEIVDRLLRWTDLSGARRRKIAVGTRGDLPDSSRRLLAARFGEVVAHVAPADLMGAGVPRARAPRERIAVPGKGG
jgi:hypothetical protein